ncbi:unnamed protein product [Polarella glacialis]|uniref:Uncharacterized protein n=1 Tax=Polarella glacialis TaxID=89957 RepID=A0A813HQ02_POLGL|nr:unnamed protein product [Polarella glacialis]
MYSLASHDAGSNLLMMSGCDGCATRPRDAGSISLMMSGCDGRATRPHDADFKFTHDEWLLWLLDGGTCNNFEIVDALGIPMPTKPLPLWPVDVLNATHDEWLS